MDLSKYKWKNRVLLVCKNENTTKKINSQSKLFKSQLKEAKERDLLLLSAKPVAFNQINGADSCTDFKMLLIGKDGRVKNSYSSPTPLKKIFALIDTMPMRRSEMAKDSL